MKARDTVARALATAMLAGEWTEPALRLRAQGMLGRSTRRSQQALIGEMLSAIHTGYPPSPDWLASFLLASPRFDRAAAPLRQSSAAIPPTLEPAVFTPAAKFADFDIPRLATVGDLAEWLGISVAHLQWYADVNHRLQRNSDTALQHYQYKFAAKRSGPPRLIEAPKPQLKAIQRRLLKEILDFVPCHDRAYGFVAGRSCLGAAQVHAGEAMVIAADLTNFFPMTPLRRVHGIFRSLGYPWAVARVLTGLCSTATPSPLFLTLPVPQRHDLATRQMFAAPHLPQGAPTSPALANLAARSLDDRLHGLARSRDANYTRYADDLVFSGGSDFARGAARFVAAVKEIANDEGYRLNARKTRIMGRGIAQRITGLTVNDHVNLPRADYDSLKATLHNCRMNGPQAENRADRHDFRAHIAGRVAWAEAVNPARALKLRRMFEEIRW